MLDDGLGGLFRRPAGFLLILAGLMLGVMIGFLLAGWLGPEEAEPTPAVLVTPSPLPSVTPLPACDGDQVTVGLNAVLSALEQEDVGGAETELEALLTVYADLIEEPACGPLGQEILGIQALVRAFAGWEYALETGSVRRLDEVAMMAELAASLAPYGRAQTLAAGLVVAVEERATESAAATAPGRIITHPETLTTEISGGLHPLCDVNTVIKPLLAEHSGSVVGNVNRIEIISDTLFMLAGGQLMSADLERVHGPSPAVFVEAAGPEVGIAGALVDELVDMTPSADGDLLLLEKSGRILRLNLSGEWLLERRATVDEMPVAIAPYGPRSYLLDPAANQIWRYPADAEGYIPTYFMGLSILVKEGIFP